VAKGVFVFREHTFGAIEFIDAPFISLRFVGKKEFLLAVKDVLEPVHIPTS